MLARKLFDTIVDFDDIVYRNVSHQQKRVANYFDDLHDDKDWQQRANDASTMNRDHQTTLSPQNQYLHAIDYGFLLPNALPTRFSDGSFYAWYGSLSCQTSIKETVFHWHRRFLQDCNLLDESHTPIAHRSIYQVSCRALLVDLTQKVKDFPMLTQPDPGEYHETQLIGARLQQDGFPGLITCSARDKHGKNTVVLKPEVLSEPRIHKVVKYVYHTGSQEVEVIDIIESQN